MRWVPFLIFAYLFTLAQTTLGRMITLERLPIGPVGPDLLVLLAVFIGLNVRTASEGFIAGWLLGLLVDLTSAGGVAPVTRLGPMSLAFGVGVWLLVQVREAFFRDRAITQIVLSAVFMAGAYLFWLSVQCWLGELPVGWDLFGRMTLQVLLGAAYTGLLMPLAVLLLKPIRSWLVTTPPPRRDRARLSR